MVALGLAAALLVVLGVLLAVVDWNRAKPWINDKVSEATGRHFAIEGNLSAAWRWPQPLEEGWHRWIPGVTVQAEQLVVAQGVVTAGQVTVKAAIARVQGALEGGDGLRLQPPELLAGRQRAGRIRTVGRPEHAHRIDQP